MLKVLNVAPTLSVLDTVLRRRSNTDILYMRNMLPGISEYVPVAFSLNDSVVDAIKVDASRLMRRFRSSAPSGGYPRYRVSAGVDADLVYAYGVGVVGRLPVPMVYHDVFAPFWFEEDRASEPMHYKQGAIEQAAVVTTWTEHSAAVFRQQFPQHAHKMRVVPPYLSRLVHCFLPPSQKLELRKETSEVRFVFVGTDARRKGLEPVLAAWLRLTPALRRHAHLTVCSSLADGEVKIPADVEHRGYEPDVPAVLKRSDVFVMPSRRESFGLVFPEAAAAGCAIIATDDATRRSMLPATGTAFVRPTESEQIAEAMRRCIEDRMYLHTAQQAQYEHALKTWEPRRVADLHYGAFQAATEMAESAEVLRSA